MVDAWAGMQEYRPEGIRAGFFGDGLLWGWGEDKNQNQNKLKI